MTVARAFAAAQAEVASGGVLGEAARAGVADANQDDWLDYAAGGEPVGGGVRAPRAIDHIGGAAVKKVLAIVEIKHGKAAFRFGAIRLREVDENVSIGREEVRVELRENAVTRVFVKLMARHSLDGRLGRIGLGKWEFL